MDGLGKDLFLHLGEGLGVRALEDMVKAISCKLWWHMQQRDSASPDFMFSKYIVGHHPLPVQTCNPTGPWKRLMGIREIVEAKI